MLLLTRTVAWDELNDRYGASKLYTSSYPQRNRNVQETDPDPQVTKSNLILPFTICCAVATLLSAFLVFQIQPVISKMILPWFGGGPAIWTSCMMFFQLMLLAGYAYAYSINRFLSLKAQVIVHMSLVIMGLLFLPIIPDGIWKPTDGSQPTLRILGVLLAHVGLPYFLLSATAPLLQAWYAAKLPGKIPYRLYALSNAGSLFALLSFPFLIEPLMSSSMQAYVWAGGFIAFAMFCAGMTAIILGSADHRRIPSVEPASDTTAVRDDSTSEPGRVTFKGWCSWLAFAAIGSFALLSISNHICLEMTVSPLMWVLPLSLYLLTFIINFEFPQCYKPRIWAIGTIVAIVVFAYINHNSLYRLDEFFPSSNDDSLWSDYSDSIVWQTSMSLITLFFICMLCHGELVRHKPHSKYLTSFYMAMATGGAVGGMTVAVLCPMLLSSFLETQITLVAGLAVACLLPVLLSLRSNNERNATQKGRLIITCLASIGIGLSGSWLIFSGNWNGANKGTIIQCRNFYGVLRVDLEQTGPDKPAGKGLYYGQTLHGFQFNSKELAGKPTTYYSRDSGLGIAIKKLGKKKDALRIGIVGLGAGTTAAYGRLGDHYHFYEINPDVVTLAKSPFTYLSNSAAEIEITLADARVAMERQPTQNFDLLALDAFSGDAIPAHLLTMEAFKIYVKHLRKDGIIAIHISNRYLNLYPVVAGLAEGNGYSMVCIDTDYDDSNGQDEASSSWCLLTADKAFINQRSIQRLSSDDYYNDAPPIRWTDQYSNLLEVLD